MNLTVNGKSLPVTSPPDTPLLYVLRDELGIDSPQFGCGLAQCGACSVLVDGLEVRSCVTPASMAVGKEVTTLEGLPARWAARKHLAQNQATQNQAKEVLHPVQVAWIEQQVPLCGFCQSGMMIKATELLEHKAHPTDAEISEAFTTGGVSPRLCRCGTYIAIRDAVRHASKLMAEGEV
jgi:aerobic-type carbon monoxide dehydrogenase small subunit (CoxS/CutS family)